VQTFLLGFVSPSIRLNLRTFVYLYGRPKRTAHRAFFTFPATSRYFIPVPLLILLELFTPTSPNGYSYLILPRPPPVFLAPRRNVCPPARPRFFTLNTSVYRVTRFRFIFPPNLPLNRSFQALPSAEGAGFSLSVPGLPFTRVVWAFRLSDFPTTAPAFLCTSRDFCSL